MSETDERIRHHVQMSIYKALNGGEGRLRDGFFWVVHDSIVHPLQETTASLIDLVLAEMRSPAE